MNTYKVEITKVTSYDVEVNANTSDEAKEKALAIPFSELPAPSYDKIGVSWVDPNEG